MVFKALNSLYRVSKRFSKYKKDTRADMSEGCREKLDLEFISWVLFGGRTKDKKNNYKKHGNI